MPLAAGPAFVRSVGTCSLLESVDFGLAAAHVVSAGMLCVVERGGTDWEGRYGVCCGDEQGYEVGSVWSRVAPRIRGRA